MWCWFCSVLGFVKSAFYVPDFRDSIHLSLNYNHKVVKAASIFEVSVVKGNALSAKAVGLVLPLGLRLCGVWLRFEDQNLESVRNHLMSSSPISMSCRTCSGHSVVFTHDLVIDGRKKRLTWSTD